MIPAPILVPWEHEPRFIWGDAKHAEERLPLPDARPPRFDAFTEPFEFEPLKVVVVRRQEFRSTFLGRVILFHMDADKERALDALRLAEVAVAFIAWTRRVAALGGPAT